MAAHDLKMLPLGQKGSNAVRDALIPGISALIFAALLGFAFKDADAFRNLWGRSTTVRTFRPMPQPRVIPEKKKPVRKVRIEPPPAPEKLPPQIQAAMPTFEMSVPVPPFPQGVTVKSGMRRGDLVTKYGKPAFSATWYDSTGVTEKYLYMDQKSVTSVVIQNGKVSSSNTEDSTSFAEMPQARATRMLE